MEIILFIALAFILLYVITWFRYKQTLLKKSNEFNLQIQALNDKLDFTLKAHELEKENLRSTLENEKHEHEENKIKLENLNNTLEKEKHEQEENKIKLENLNSTLENEKQTNIQAIITLENEFKAKEERLHNEFQIKESNFTEKLDLLENSAKENKIKLENLNNTLEKEKHEQEENKIKLENLNSTLENEKQTNIQAIITLENEFKAKEERLHNEFQIKESNFTEKLDLLEHSQEKRKIEFENLANKLFEEHNKKSNINLNQVLNPFKEKIEDFSKRVNDIYTEETKQRVSLTSQIENLKNLNYKISEDAINLTKALKGENKIQGDWGEMILSSILEQTGLSEGKEYSTQGSYTNEEGKRLRPDVVVHLPSNKDIIIDSKVSLNSYLDYMQNDDVIKKDTYLKNLNKSLITHIKGLSVKKYEDIKDLRTLDFVLMFIPIEQAFLLATSKNQNLFKMAFEHNIVLVSSSTLFVTLRTIENIWRYEHQNENALLISKKAGDLYDKFALFLKDIELIGTHITRTQKSYDDAMNKLSTGKGNLIRRSEEFIQLGIKANKKIDSLKYLEK